MKFKLIIFLLFAFSCSPQFTTINQKQPYTSKGFAYIYNNFDFEQKIIKGKMNNDILQISHQYLKTGTLVKVINPKNNVNASFLVYPFLMSKTVNNAPIIKADIEVSLLKHI